MEKNKYFMERNRDKDGTRNHLLFLWASFSYHFENNNVDECNHYTQLLEKYLPFENEEEHQKWLDILFEFKFYEDLEEITKKIIDRLTPKEKNELILSYEQVAKDLCYCCEINKVFNAFEKLTHYVYKIQDFDKFWKQLCKSDWELQIFLENYRHQFHDYLDIEKLKKSTEYIGLEDTPSCVFFKENLESKYDLMECIFERYAMGLEDDECLDFFKALIKELSK